MPKIRTNRSAAKRFRRTASGKLKRFKAGKRHILSSKTAKRKRRLRKATYVAKVEQKRMERLLPY